MNEQAGTKKIAINALVVVLWLVTFVLGLECIYALKDIFFVIYVALGGSLTTAEQIATGLVFFLGIAATVFVIGSAEYHRKHVGTSESWRFFGWTLGAEASIIVLRYILL